METNSPSISSIELPLTGTIQGSWTINYNRYDPWDDLESTDYDYSMDLIGCWLAKPDPVSIEPTFVFIDIDDTTVESTSINFNRFTIASACGSIYYELDISSSSDSNFDFSDKYTFTEAASAS